jgi:hypothetical protein
MTDNRRYEAQRPGTVHCRHLHGSITWNHVNIPVFLGQFVVILWTDRLRLVQSSSLPGSTDTRRTPSYPFHIRLSACDWLFCGSERQGVRFIRRFLLGVMVCHSVLGLSTRSPLWFGWPAGGEDCSLESSVELRRRSGKYRAKTSLVWGF